MSRKELREEEERLDQMMEQERLRSIKEMEARNIGQSEKKKEYIEALDSQIKMNQMQREIQAERLEEEAKVLAEQMIEIQIQDVKALQEKFLEQERKREDMIKTNEAIKKVAEEERRQAKLADLKIEECIRRKIEEEENREKEKKMQKMLKEKEMAKLLLQQERDCDNKAEKDRIAAQRQMSEMEIKKRREEKEAIAKKQRAVQELIEGRAKQIEEKRRAQAEEMEESKREVLKMKKLLELEYEREKEEQNKKREEIYNYRMLLLKQMNEKEKEKIKERKELFKEGITINRDEQVRQEGIQRLIRRKIDDIKNHNVPEKYIEEIQVKLKLGKDDDSSEKI